MKMKWYGDKLDLVKWSVLLILARRHQIDRVLQLAFLRSTDFPGVIIDGDSYDIPSEVISHFRDLTSIIRLTTHPRITLFPMPFEDRSAYMDAALELIRTFSSE